MQTIKINGGVVVLDDIDAEMARTRAWHLGASGYAMGYNSVNTIRNRARLHRIVMERVIGRALSTGEYVDHINHNKLDNRRCNLRLASKSQNGMNTLARGGRSKFIGVGMRDDGRAKKWMTYINIDGTRFYLGEFYDEMEAAWMRDQYALALHGEFAQLNFEYVPVPTQFSTAAA